LTKSRTPQRHPEENPAATTQDAGWAHVSTASGQHHSPSPDLAARASSRNRLRSNLRLIPAVSASPDCDIELLQHAQTYAAARRRRDAQAAAATEAGWDAFYARYTQFIRRCLSAHHAPPQEYADCLAQVWQSIWEKLPSFRYDPSRRGFRSWISTIAFRRVADAFRRGTRRRAQSLDDMTGTSAEPCGPDPELGVQLERIDDLERLDAALGQLRAESFPKSYAVFHMVAVEGRSVSEAAATHQMNAAAVRGAVWRLKQRLSRMLHSLQARA
jgi:RNA polymerase sigma factor (sigma-70 family)